MERKIRNDAIYSQECLVDAFLKLLAKKRVQDITISEICKTAGLARITFYKYFKTINDLLKTAVEFKFNEFKRELMKVDHKNNIQKVLEVTIRQVTPLKDSLRMLAKSNMSGILLQYFTEGVKEIFPLIEKDFELKRIKYLFIAGGIFNILTDWVKNNMNETPEKMAEQIYVTMINGWLK